MDTSIFGHSFLSAAAAKTATKTRQSPLLLCWLAHCDDVTSHDIIIILINAVTHHDQLLAFNFWWLRTWEYCTTIPFLTETNWRIQEVMQQSMSCLLTDWQAGMRWIWTEWGDREWSRAARGHQHADMVVAGYDWWARLGDRKGDVKKGLFVFKLKIMSTHTVTENWQWKKNVTKCSFSKMVH